jgi:hypothetical protein
MNDWTIFTIMVLVAGYALLGYQVCKVNKL